MITLDSRAFLNGLAEACADYAQKGYAESVYRAEAIKDAAQARAPRGATGDLVASIEVTEGSAAAGPYVEVGTRLDYGLYQEFGTCQHAKTGKGVPPHPFMRPAIEEQLGAGLDTSATFGREEPATSQSERYQQTLAMFPGGG